MGTKASPSSFWARVEKPSATSCWPWSGGRDQDGYGLTEMQGKRYRAHRLAWELTNGKIPEGKIVRHRCDNPPCCNPEHLQAGSHAENMADMIERGRSKLVHGGPGRSDYTSIQGESHYCAKLTATDVKNIRSISGMTHRGIAKLYGVSATSIWQIVNRVHWAHVP